MSCTRAQEFLAQAKATIATTIDAKKQRYSEKDAIALARTAAELFVAKGKNVTHVDLVRSPPSDAELARLLLGPSGNLRAPAIRSGRTLYIGFSPEMLSRLE
jgi:arsenate reductase-like glutaredoxin family protein